LIKNYEVSKWKIILRQQVILINYKKSLKLILRGLKLGLI
jgi:hypothetical protein